MTEVPQDVLVWVQGVFAECNRRVTNRLDRNPNAPEESFDLTWIEQVGRYSSPTIFPSKWTAKIETHYLGGLRHFGRWEIADIGVLVFLRLAQVSASTRSRFSSPSACTRSTAQSAKRP